MQRIHYRPFHYFTLTFILTSLFWGVGAYASFHEPWQKLYFPLMFAGLLTPFLLSLAMLRGTGHPGVLRDFLDRLFNVRRIRLSTLPTILVLMPAVVLVSLGLSLLAGEPLSQLRLAEEFSFSAFVPVLLLLVFAAVFEELGWRGYAFDSLHSRMGFLRASLLFSLLWSLWHLPLVLVKDSYQYLVFRESVWFGVNFFVSILPMGVILSWVCVRNRKSILAAILFHFMINISQEALQITQVTKAIETGVLVIAAGALIALDRQIAHARKTGLAEAV